MNPARRADWKIEAMPDSAARLGVEKTYTRDEFARLRFGVVPNSMDEKWFIYFEPPWLYIHRSWTGLCIYQVRFEETETGARISEAIANRNREQYGGTDTSADAGRLLFLLDSVLQRNARYVNARLSAESI